MTHRFRTALLSVGVLALATFAIWFVLGRGAAVDDSGGEPDPVDRARVDEPSSETPRLGGPEAGGTPTSPGPGVPARPSSSGSVIGLRTPEGIDLSDPKVLDELLQRELSDRPIDWDRVTQLLRVVDGELGEDVRKALLDALATGDRGGAVRALAAVRDGTLAPDLFALLDDPEISPAAWRAAVGALGFLQGANDAEIIRGLESRLKGVARDDIPLLQAIGRRGGSEAARAIVEYLLRTDSPATLPHYGYLSLDLVNDVNARGVVERALAEASSPAVLRALVSLSAQPGADAMVPALVDLDRGGQSSELRRDVLAALSRIGTQSAVDYLLDVGSQPGTYGELALQNIGRIGSATVEARARLVHALQETEKLSDPGRARIELLRALGNLSERTALDAMVGAVNDPDPKVRMVAVRGVGNVGAPAREHVSTLMSVFTTGDESLQRQVATALGGIGGDTAKQRLQAMMADSSLPPTVVATARQALQRMRQREGTGG